MQNLYKTFTKPAQTGCENRAILCAKIRSGICKKVCTVIEPILHLKRHLTSFQIMILGFAGVILLGALVLMLPIATVQRV